MMFLEKVITSNQYTCGGTNFVFSGTMPNMVSTIIQVIQIIVPILLIIFGMLDLGKAVAASKEDEIKKGQQLFLKRAITAVIVFFVILLVQIVVRLVSGNNASVMNCLNCFVHGDVGPTSCELTEVDD